VRGGCEKGNRKKGENQKDKGRGKTGNLG
jgi:hypothetical protein